MTSGPPTSWRRALSLALGLLAALSILLPQAARAQSMTGQVITDIRVQGNRKIESDAIKAVVHSQVGGRVDTIQVRKDIKDVYNLGFFNDVQIVGDIAPGGVVLTVVVKEKPAIKAVIYEGNDKVSTEDLQEVLTLRLYTILDDNAVQQNVSRLRATYAEKGYFLAKVTAELRPVGQDDVSVVFVIDEGQKVLVKRTYFVGDEEIPSTEFERFLTNQNGGYMAWLSNSGTFSKEALEDDALIISAYYFDKGYVQVRVETPEVFLSPDRTYLAITHRITEGERFKVASVDVDGEFVLPKDELMDLVTLEEGEWFSRTLLGNDIQALSDAYSDLGYAFADVIPLTKTNEDEKTIEITYKLTKNSKVYLNQIHIGGNSVTWDKTIRRELLINEGELFRGSVVKDGKRRLERLGYFEEVAITTPRIGDDKLDLNVQVKEKPTGNFNVGAGLSSVENFVFTGNVSKQNFLGLGFVMSAAASVSGVRQQYSLSFYDPYFLDSRWTFRVDGYNIDQTLYQDEFRRGLAVAFGHYIGRKDDAIFQLRYSFEQQGLSNLSVYLLQLYGGELYRSGDSSSMEASLTIDKRNNRITPTSGYRFSWASELAGGFALGQDGRMLNLLGGDFNFHRHQLNFRYYYPLVQKSPDALVFRFNSTLGAIFSTDGTMIPLLQRYRAGGINSVRGFPILSLGPTTRYLLTYEPTNPDAPRTVGGYQIMATNIEMEFSIVRAAGIRGVVFLDSGNAFDLFGYDRLEGADPEEIRRDRLPRFAAGLGVRWFSPMGPLRFEWGWPLDRREGEDPRQFEFTIGSFF